MIEFLVDLGCPVKDVVRSEGLMRALKSRARVAEALAAADQQGVAPADVQVRLVRVDGEGGEKTEVASLSDLEAASAEAMAPLAPLAGACETCRARVSREPFGCYGTIGYPIAAATEEFLMDWLPPMLGTVGGTFLVKAVRELGYDGAPIARMRLEGRTFFERERPVRQRWMGEDGAWEVSSDQLLHMMFFSGRTRMSHALLLALVLGVIPHGVTPEALSGLVSGGPVPEDLVEPTLLPAVFAKTQLAEVVRFLEAVRRAVMLGSDLVVDA